MSTAVFSADSDDRSLRSTGFHRIDAQAAGALGIAVVCVADDWQHSVMELAVGSPLAVSRRIARASLRARGRHLELVGLVGSACTPRPRHGAQSRVRAQGATQ